METNTRSNTSGTPTSLHRICSWYPRIIQALHTLGWVKTVFNTSDYRLVHANRAEWYGTCNEACIIHQRTKTSTRGWEASSKSKKTALTHEMQAFRHTTNFSLPFLLHATSIDHVNDIVNRKRRLCNVCRDDDFGDPCWRLLEYGMLLVSAQAWMERKQQTPALRDKQGYSPLY